MLRLRLSMTLAKHVILNEVKDLARLTRNAHRFALNTMSTFSAVIGRS